jgi:hypothetical protein
MFMLVMDALQLSLFWSRSIQSTPPYTICSRFILILITHIRLGLPSGLFPSNNLYAFLFSPSVRLLHASHGLNSIALIILGEKYNSCSSSLCSFLKLPVTSTLFGPRISSVPSSWTPSVYVPPLCQKSSFMPIQNHSKITDLYFLIFTFFGTRQEDRRFWTEWYQALPKFLNQILICYCISLTWLTLYTFNNWEKWFFHLFKMLSESASRSPLSFFTKYNFETVIREPSLYRLHTFHVPNRTSLILSLRSFIQRIHPGPRLSKLIRNKLIFLRWGVVSFTPNRQTGRSPLVVCPRLLISYIHSDPPSWRSSLLHS